MWLQVFSFLFVLVSSVGLTLSIWVELWRAAR